MFKLQVNDEIYLKLLEVRDAEKLFELVDHSRHSLREWLPWLDYNQTSKDSEQFIKTALNQFANNQGFQAGIYYKSELAGVIGYHWINWSNRNTSIGYWLGEGYVGKGIMTKACQAVIDYSFQELHLNRVEIRCAVGNKRSRAIPERLGLQNEGCARQSEWLYDHYVDHIIYGMIKEDWKSKKGTLS